MTTARQHEGSQGAAYRPPLLDLKRVSVLVDTAMHLLDMAYELKQEAERDADAWLRAEMKRLDLFGPRFHYNDDEQDYSPSGGEDR